MKTTELVFVPSPGAGHVASTVEFAKRLVQRDERLTITILSITLTYYPTVDAYAKEITAVYPSIKFLILPPVPPQEFCTTTSGETQYALFIEQHKPHVKDAIVNNVLSNSNISLGGIVVDFLCSSMIDVAIELDVPSYLFHTASLNLLALMLYLPTHYTQKGSEFSLSDPDYVIPGFSDPVPANVLPSLCFNKDSYETYLDFGIKIKKTKGIFLNTFLELEARVIESLASQPETPPLYTLGPIIHFDSSKKDDLKGEKIMQWLNDQPSSSVIFLCFGSYGSFGKEQLTQIATGLERSGHKFLWSLRKKISSATYTMPGDYTDFGEDLPEGFLERTRNRGMVCGWAPQKEVLAHEAIGSFVSHCGWNSVLEAIWYGKPIVTWPMYAEQQLNAFKLVKEVGLAVELSLTYSFEKGDKEIVMAEEIEKAIKSMMEENNPLRNRVKEMSDISRKAGEKEGSSFVSTGRLIEDIFQNKV